MNWFLSVAMGLLTAPLGCIGAFFVAERCVRWYRISGFEGGSAYFVVSQSLLGLIIGIGSARLVAGSESAGYLKGLIAAWGTKAALLLLVTLVAWSLADLPPTLAGRRVELALELCSPPGFVVPTSVEGHRAYAVIDFPQRGRALNRGQLRFDKVTPTEGNAITPATVPLETSRPNKLLLVQLGEAGAWVFPLPLRRRLTQEDLAWSDWIDCLTPMGQSSPAPAPRCRMRYRVQLVDAPVSLAE